MATSSTRSLATGPLRTCRNDSPPRGARGTELIPFYAPRAPRLLRLRLRHCLNLRIGAGRLRRPSLLELVEDFAFRVSPNDHDRLARLTRRENGEHRHLLA